MVVENGTITSEYYSIELHNMPGQGEKHPQPPAKRAKTAKYIRERFVEKQISRGTKVVRQEVFSPLPATPKKPATPSNLSTPTLSRLRSGDHPSTSRNPRGSPSGNVSITPLQTEHEFNFFIPNAPMYPPLKIPRSKVREITQETYLFC